MQQINCLRILIVTAIGLFISSSILAQPKEVTLASVDPSVYQLYAGNYRLGAGRLVSVGPFSEADGNLMFYDSHTRRVGILYPVSATEFMTGTVQPNGRLIPADLAVEFGRDRQGRVTGVTWREGNTRAVKGVRVDSYRNQEVTFQNGEVTLHGTLTTPVGTGPFPAVVFLQEAGPRIRPFGMWPYLFARRGIALLTFDKRGSGASSGQWATASFADLAGDARAAIDLLRARPEIDRRQIGIWGNSNSGWYVPLVAARSDSVAFVIDRVGSALTPSENVLYEIEGDLRGQGFDDAEIKQAVGLRRMLQNAILHNDGWEQFRTSANASRNERWFSFSRVGRYLAAQLPPDNVTLGQWRAPLDYDPIRYWEKVKCPVLAMFGADDQSTPTARNVPPLTRALNQAGNHDFTITVLPHTGHGFFENPSSLNGYTWVFPPLQRYAKGYVDGMMNWLVRHVRTTHRPRSLPLSRKHSNSTRSTSASA